MLELESIIDRHKDRDRILTIPEATWAEYESLKSLDFRLLISFFNNTITIVTPGRNHERIAEAIRTIVAAYCRKYKIRYWALGSEDIK